MMVNVNKYIMPYTDPTGIGNVDIAVIFPNSFHLLDMADVAIVVELDHRLI